MTPASGLRENERVEGGTTNLTIEVPDELARSLEGIAASQRVTVEQLALEGLSSLVETRPAMRTGTAASVLRAMRELPQIGAADTDELDAAISAGRLPVRAFDPF